MNNACCRNGCPWQSRMRSDQAWHPSCKRLTSTELYVKQLLQIRFRSLAKLFLVLYILFLTFFSSVVRSMGFVMTVEGYQIRRQKRAGLG